MKRKKKILCQMSQKRDFVFQIETLIEFSLLSLCINCRHLRSQPLWRLSDPRPPLELTEMTYEENGVGMLYFTVCLSLEAFSVTKQ